MMNQAGAFGTVAAILRGAADRCEPPSPLSWGVNLKNAVTQGKADKVVKLLAELRDKSQEEAGLLHTDMMAICRDVIGRPFPPHDMIFMMIHALPDSNRLDLFEDKTVLPSSVVLQNDVELANFYMDHGFEPQIASTDVHHAQLELKNLVFRRTFATYLKAINANPEFWEKFDTFLGHHHHHGPQEDDVAEQDDDYQIQGNFRTAKEEISSAINILFAGEGYKPEDKTHREHAFRLYAFIKAHDQLTMGENFVSPEQRDLVQFLGISSSLKGITIGDDTRKIPNGRDYLIDKFELYKAWPKLVASYETNTSLLNVNRTDRTNGMNDTNDTNDTNGTNGTNGTNQYINNSMLNAVRHLSCGFKIASDGLEISVRRALVLMGYAPSKIYERFPFLSLGGLALVGLALGSSMSVFRIANEQDIANLIRDNIGAAFEAFSFFVIVNGGLDNLFHSTALILPACLLIAFYHYLVRPLVNAAHDQFFAKPNDSATASRSDSVRPNSSQSTDTNNGADADLIDGFYSNQHALKFHDFVTNVNDLLLAKKDEIWSGLNKSQKIYPDNKIENKLKNDLNSLIDRLSLIAAPGSDTSENINKVLLKDFKQTLKDTSEILKAYADVLKNKGTGAEIQPIIDDFLLAFKELWINDASSDAEQAAYYLRSENGLGTWVDWIKASFPEMPSGRELLVAGAVIGTFLGVIQVTGRKKELSDYFLNTIAYLFKVCKLDQLYENLGGGAELTEAFKEFFAIFNTTENSSHFFLAVLPIIAYLRKGGAMFETLHHAPANWLASLDEMITGGAITDSLLRKRVSAPISRDIEVGASSTASRITAADIQANAGVAVQV